MQQLLNVKYAELYSNYVQWLNELWRIIQVGKNINLKSGKWKPFSCQLVNQQIRYSQVSSQSAEQSLDIVFYTSQIIVTEIIWVLKTVSSGQSLRSNEITVDCFIKIFPDSKIIERVSIGKTKSI